MRLLGDPSTQPILSLDLVSTTQNATKRGYSYPVLCSVCRNFQTFGDLRYGTAGLGGKVAEVIGGGILGERI